MGRGAYDKTLVIGDKGSAAADVLVSNEEHKAEAAVSTHCKPSRCTMALTVDQKIAAVEAAEAAEAKLIKDHKSRGIMVCLFTHILIQPGTCS